MRETFGRAVAFSEVWHPIEHNYTIFTEHATIDIDMGIVIILYGDGNATRPIIETKFVKWYKSPSPLVRIITTKVGHPTRDIFNMHLVTCAALLRPQLTNSTILTHSKISPPSHSEIFHDPSGDSLPKFKSGRK